MSAADRSASRRLVWLVLAALTVAFGIDLHFDVRDRDVLGWMDPYQYYDFARALAAGQASLASFELPSVFPLLLLPAVAIDASIPSALLANAAFAALLVFAVDRLCRELSLATASPVIAALVLASPLLIGLSRSLYVEFALTAVATLAFAYWLRFLHHPDFGSGARFAAIFALGFGMKTTFPLFFAAPVAGAVLGRLRAGRSDDALAFVYASLVPLAGVVLLHNLVFAGASGYYASLGNTAIPIMRLIGPPDPFSWGSIGYYFGVIAWPGLGLLALGPLLAAVLLLRRIGRFGIGDLASPRAALWLWLVGPLLVLIAQPVKEPRHVAPCVVPAVLLTIAAIESLPRRPLRAVGVGAAALLAVTQFAWVLGGDVEVPYRLDRALHWNEIRRAMVASDESPLYAHTPAADRALHWSYNQDVALAGFSANEALALTWQLFPGVTVDLETRANPARSSPEIPYARFEDLYLLCAFDTYNRRSGWRHYSEALSREQVLRNADVILVNGATEGELSTRYPNHVLVATIARDAGAIRVLRSRLPTRPFRAIYAQQFLARNAMLDAGERRVVEFDLLMTAALGGYRGRAANLARRDPGLPDAFGSIRNIYWIGGYERLVALMRERDPAL